MNNDNILVWLERMLNIDFKGKEVIREQVKKAKFTVEEHYAYISVKISILNDADKFPFPVRVPVEMRVYQEAAAPIVFLLHIIEGYINELEIITADSSKIDIVNLRYQKVEYEINKELVFLGTKK